MPGLYIGCWLEPDTAERIALAGGEPPEQLHVTLCYLGELEELGSWVPGEAVAAAARTAARTRPLEGVLPGLGVFKAADSDVLYASVDAPGLAELREQLVGCLGGYGIEPAGEHGFTPHVTLAYLPPGTSIDVSRWEPSPILLKAVTVASGDNGFRVELPFLGPGEPMVPPEPSAEDVVRIAKVDDEKRLVYGVVLQPEIEDSQGDVIAREDVELAAHRFLYHRRPLGLQHLALAPADVRPVESFVAPCDFAYDENPDQLILKGSWVLVAHIPDDIVWKAARDGIFTGWSLEGRGTRTPLEA